MSLRKTIKKFPLPIQKTFKYLYSFTPISIRYGKVFWDTYHFLEESQWWDRDKLRNYQFEQLKLLLIHAKKNVPYYQKLFNRNGIDPRKINDLQDIQKIPYLTKEIIKKNTSQFLIKNVDKKNLYIAHTSGTTGKPLQWYISLSEDQKEYAFICHQWSRMGFYPGNRMVQLRGAILNNSKMFEYDPIFNVIRLSPKIIGKENVKNYLKIIRDSKARFLHGYPSIISVFAATIKENKLAVPFELKAVFFASEAVYPWERKITEEVFNCRVFSHYGNAEKVVLAGECENTNNCHSIPQYGITEIDNNEIIGTSFIDYTTPFIRYRTNDFANVAESMICDCKRQYYPIFKTIEGRLEDFIISAKGEYISPAVITHPLKDFSFIKETQIIQHSFDRIEVSVVPYINNRHTILEKELQEIKSGLHEIIGKNTKIEVNIVKHLNRTKSGKLKWIISKVSKNSLKKGFID